MNITKKEVKTIYSITMNIGDLFEGVIRYRDDESFRCLTRYGNAFDGLDVFSKDEDVEKFMKKMQFTESGTSTIRYMVERVFEFDGIENFGTYNEKNKEIRLTVYEFGNRM